MKTSMILTGISVLLCLNGSSQNIEKIKLKFAKATIV